MAIKRGTLKNWLAKGGYGFILTEESGEEAFVHHTELKDYEDIKDKLKKGAVLKFKKLKQSEKAGCVQLIASGSDQSTLMLLKVSNLGIPTCLRIFDVAWFSFCEGCL